MTSIPDRLQPDALVRSPLFPEPLRIITVTPRGEHVKLIATGVQSGRTYTPYLSEEQLQSFVVTPAALPFDGDATRFRLGAEAMRLALAYEYDPYFALSIARIDPLPHQLEAVYDHFVKSPRIRFLLADDPGAGKTIMAGLLIQELKARGLVKRILIVTPANLTFQWQRELLDKFRQDFGVLNSAVLRTNYGRNPWLEADQVITSVSWISRVEDARDSLLRTTWDMVIVDEAHKMSAGSPDNKTLAYQLGEALSDRTDHLLLMTATPHKGDPLHFSLFLRLLDQDVYGDVQSLQEAINRQEAPFYLRRVKEALVSFPDPETGMVKKLFTRRTVHTIKFQIDADEWDFYDALTHYVEEQSAQAALDDSARGRAVGFTMAMLQRRFASSVYAVRRTLERMRHRRQRILDDPEAYRQQMLERSVPDDYDDLPEDEQQRILEELESTVLTVDPAALRDEVADLTRLIQQAVELERREVESKLTRLKKTLTEEGVFADPTMKVLIFTEHKDTLDYLVGDGRDGRPLGKLREWGLSVTQIHGSMKPGDRNTPGSRVYAEWDFKQNCQVMVATEAAGEGINLQFCWFLINYDIPWNPVRLEQRMGRIHRYGQERDCLIVNFVATNTREGRVLDKLFERVRAIEADLDPNGMGTVFNVLGDLFPSNQLERMVREMYARNLDEKVITDRIVREVDVERFRRITHSTLEGLAKRDLNLAAIVGKAAEAKERRLVPEVIEDFFLKAAPLAGLTPRAAGKSSHVYRIGRVPTTLTRIGARQEQRFGRLGDDYREITFDKELLRQAPTLEWVTPGHPLFEAVRQAIAALAQDDMERGAVFYDLQRKEPGCLDLFSVRIDDGRGRTLRQHLYIVETAADGTLAVREPTLLLDLQPALTGTTPPDPATLPAVDVAESVLLEGKLLALVDEVRRERTREIEIVSRHVEVSMAALLDKQNLRLIDLLTRQGAGESDPLQAANIAQTEKRLEELNHRLEQRRAELAQERHCTIAAVTHHGRAWVLPHPERTHPDVAPMVRDEEVERIAVQMAIAYEEARGCIVESVEAENRGFDLISRRPSLTNPDVAAELRFIEVKGRAGVGLVALSSNEYQTAERLKDDYWLYVVYNCRAATKPQLHCIQNPARLDWQPVQNVVHYQLDANNILAEETSA
jgi:superfamily II DNA or RNA helicase